MLRHELIVSLPLLYNYAMNPKGKKLMTVFARPDDAEIWAGGTLVKWNECGGKSKIVCFTTDNMRKEEALQGANILGSELLIIDDNPEFSRSIIDQLSKEIEEFSPDVLITHTPQDSHPEHRVAFEIVSSSIINSRIKQGTPKLLLCADTYNEICLDGVSLREIKKDYNKHKNVVLGKYIRDQVSSLPVKTTTIIDYGGKEREIFVYCIHERWLQMYLKLQIEQNIEESLKSYVFGYRKGVTMKDLHSYLLSTGLAHILHLDIAKYFDQIDREPLFNFLEHNIGVSGDTLVKIQKSVSHTDKGLPQGNVLSPVLSNAYLTPFDECFPENYARFSDDLYFALDTPRKKDEMVEKISERLLKHKLKINYSKLEIKNVNKF